jgi:hypothetical protein
MLAWAWDATGCRNSREDAFEDADAVLAITEADKAAAVEAERAACMLVLERMIVVAEERADDAVEAERAACEAVVREIGPMILRVKQQENYSGEHREWFESVTVPRGCGFFQDIADAIAARKAQP